MSDPSFPQDPSQDPERRLCLPNLWDDDELQIQPILVPESFVGRDDPKDQPRTDEPSEAV